MESKKDRKKYLEEDDDLLYENHANQYGDEE
jgi:hypothetical protein